MGSWSSAITADDTVADVMGAVGDRLKRGESMADACAAVRREFRALLDDEDEAPLLWLALAAVQWRHGAVEPEVLAQLQEDLRAHRGLERWREDEALLAERLAQLRRFADHVASPNAKPQALPKLVVRRAPFDTGDCLAVHLDDGRYTAALVLATNNSNAENGMNLVAGLDYLGGRMPAIADFKRRRWLYKHHGAWHGEQDLQWCMHELEQQPARLQLVGRVPVRWWHRRRCDSYGAWSNVGQHAPLNRCHLDSPDDA